MDAKTRRRVLMQGDAVPEGWAKVDLGTLTYYYYAGYRGFYAALYPSAKPALDANTPNTCRLAGYVSVSDNMFNAGVGDLEISIPFIRNPLFKIRNLAYTDAAQFKAAMSGKYLIYEKA